jgi:hypothetical protein
MEINQKFIHSNIPDDRDTFEIHCVRKVALHLGYGMWIWLSVSKMPLNCALFHCIQLLNRTAVKVQYR